MRTTLRRRLALPGGASTPSAPASRSASSAVRRPTPPRWPGTGATLATAARDRSRASRRIASATTAVDTGRRPGCREPNGGGTGSSANRASVRKFTPMTPALTGGTGPSFRTLEQALRQATPDRSCSGTNSPSPAASGDVAFFARAIPRRNAPAAAPRRDWRRPGPARGIAGTRDAAHHSARRRRPPNSHQRRRGLSAPESRLMRIAWGLQGVEPDCRTGSIQ